MKEAPFIAALQKTIASFPDRVALCVDGKIEYTYAQLWHEITQRTLLFTKHGAGPGRVIALELEKSAEYIFSLLACWRVGAAFMPLVPSLPPLRRQAMFDMVKPIFRYDASGKLSVMADAGLYDETLAYLLFTSGSTGHPKGVMVGHDGLLPMLRAQIPAFRLNPGSRVLLYLSIQFDASLSDIGTSLLSGAALHLETADLSDLLHMLPDIVTTRGITHLDLPPSLLDALPPEIMPSLQTIIIGGESCLAETVRRWSQRVHLVNVYGPTEATICTSLSFGHADWQAGSIGKPIEGVNYVLRDEQGEVAAPGETGELSIGGPCVALGYAGAPELTAQRFYHAEGKRWYRTGDLVRQELNGSYVFLGRIDRQFKHRGQLVAPEEIEAALAAHPNVERAAVTYRHARIVAHVETAMGALSIATLRLWLAARLPRWMVPHAIHLLPALPLLENGKIDFLVLPDAIGEDAAISAHPDGCRLQRLCQQVLGLSYLPGVEDDFFDELGGDSLAALQLVLLAETHGIPLSVGLLSECRTIAQLVPRLSPERTDALDAAFLRQEAMLTAGENARLRHYRHLPLPSSNAILLTGATGFLGSHILAELLAKTGKEIYCLVRARDGATGFQRLTSTLGRMGTTLDARALARLHVVVGDLEAADLGIARDQWAWLAQNIATIYHCGGAVQVTQPYRDLRAVNFDAVKALVRLAATGARKRLYHASTLSVFVASDRNEGVCLEEDQLTTTTRLYSGYAQSKYAAEGYVRNSFEAGLEGAVFRFGLLTGNSHTGMAGPHDYLTTFVRGLVALGALPEGNHSLLELDVTPVDYAARAMLHVAEGIASGCYHVAGDRLSCQRLVEALGAHHRFSPSLDAAAWHRLHAPSACASAAQLALCRLGDSAQFERWRSMDLFQATGVTFDQRRLNAALAGSGIACPPLDKPLLERYLSHMLVSGFNYD